MKEKEVTQTIWLGVICTRSAQKFTRIFVIFVMVLPFTCFLFIFNINQSETSNGQFVPNLLFFNKSYNYM